MKTIHLISMACALLPAIARASVLPVTSTADSGAGSLRAQVAAALAGDTISITATGTITLTTGEILIAGKDLVIEGPGPGNLTITTAATTRAIRIINSECEFRGIAFDNCKGLPGDIDTGGAIAVDNFTSGGAANLTTISDCSFTNNQSGWGGAVDIFHGGLVMSGCTFSNNTCNGLAFGTTGGGGALSLGPTVASSITNCTFSGNNQTGSAAGQPGGGAIYNYGFGTATPPAVTIEHCTFHGNVDTASEAGAIKSNHTASYHTWAELKNCLLVDNQAPATLLRNFSAAAAGTPEESFVSLGGNVTDEAATSALFMSSGGDETGNASLASTVSTTADLNGGVTRTHAITRGSPAQRAGTASTTLTDQRGAPRHGQPDAGAFELIEPELLVTESGSPVAEGGSLDFGTTPFDTQVVRTLTVTNTQTSAFATGPLVLASASPPAGVSITGFPPIVLDNGESATFDLTVDAVDPGLMDAPFIFTANDSFDPALATATPGSPNSHRFDLLALVTDTMAHWQEQHFSPPAISAGLAAPDASPAGDGITNLMKYALGLDPQVPSTLGSAIDTGLDSAGFLSLSVTRNPAATDVSLAVEVSGDLGSTEAWNTADATIDLETPTRLEAHDTIPMSAASSRFIRLKATGP